MKYEHISRQNTHIGGNLMDKKGKNKYNVVVNTTIPLIGINMYISYILSQLDDELHYDYTILEDSVKNYNSYPLHTSSEVGTPEFIGEMIAHTNRIQDEKYTTTYSEGIASYKNSDNIYGLSIKVVIDSSNHKIVENKVKILSDSLSFIKAFLRKDFREVFRLVILKGNTHEPIYKVSNLGGDNISYSRMLISRDIYKISDTKDIIPLGLFPQDENIWSIQELNIRFPNLVPLVLDNITKIESNTYAIPIVLLDESEVELIEDYNNEKAINVIRF